MSRATTSEIFERVGWGWWLTLAVTTTFTVILSIIIDQERSVTPAYSSAVYHWFAGEPLYNMSGHGFLYLPQAALAFAPWALLPHAIGEVVWRLTIIGAMAYGVLRLNRMLQGDGRWFCAMSFASTVLAWGCARNGQSTLMITALMMLAAVDLSDGKWWRATLMLSLAFAFKPLAIVMILLAAVVYPQMSWRMAIGLVVVALAPFATQRPDYVWSQYVECAQSLLVTFDVGETEKWAQLFGMLEVARINLPEPVRMGVRLAAAISTLLLCISARRRLATQQTAFYLFSLASCYLMLFNSRTEGNTYAMIGPVYGALFAEAAYRLKNQKAAGWMIAAGSLSVLNYELAILISPRPDAIWISPLACVGVSGYLVARLFQDLRQAANASTDVELKLEAPVSFERKVAA